MVMDIQELQDNFEMLDDWEDKYRYLIELGEKNTDFPFELHTQQCQPYISDSPIGKL